MNVYDWSRKTNVQLAGFFLFLGHFLAKYNVIVLFSGSKVIYQYITRRNKSTNIMEIPSMDTVYQAIDALYNNPNTSEKEKASIWLGEIQKSVSIPSYQYNLRRTEVLYYNSTKL